MHKKIIILLLIVAFCLTGCTNKQSDKNKDSNTSQVESVENNSDTIVAVSLNETARQGI